MSYRIHRYHDFSAGHRVYGHESKCAHLHGHNYRVHFDVAPKQGTGKNLDELGRVIDFSVLKRLLCDWLEANWDHKFLIWEEDPDRFYLYQIDPKGVVFAAFNPTAENMAHYLVTVVAPILLLDEDVELVSCTIEETRKCSVTYDTGRV